MNQANNSNQEKNSFKPKSRTNSGFKPRGGGNYMSKGDGGRDNNQRRSGDFKPRRDGDSRPRRDGDFKHRRDGDFRPRRDGDSRPRRDGDFKPRRDGDFRPRRDGDSRPRRDGDFKPRRDGDFKPRRDGDFKPRRDGDFKPRREGNFKPGNNGFQKPTRANGFNKTGVEKKSTFNNVAYVNRTIESILKSINGNKHIFNRENIIDVDALVMFPHTHAIMVANEIDSFREWTGEMLAAYSKTVTLGDMVKLQAELPKIIKIEEAKVVGEFTDFPTFLNLIEKFPTTLKRINAKNVNELSEKRHFLMFCENNNIWNLTDINALKLVKYKKWCIQEESYLDLVTTLETFAAKYIDLTEDMFGAMYFIDRNNQHLEEELIENNEYFSLFPEFADLAWDNGVMSISEITVDFMNKVSELYSEQKFNSLCSTIKYIARTSEKKAKIAAEKAAKAQEHIDRQIAATEAKKAAELAELAKDEAITNEELVSEVEVVIEEEVKNENNID